jgi:hypothetical protein
MSRIGLANMAWGFFLIFTAACGGVFIALRLTETFMINAQATPAWDAILQTSSHGHTALFGSIHVLFGLTLPYDGRTLLVKKLKSFGLLMGSVAMGPLMLIRAAIGPTLSTEVNGIALGSCLSLALIAILSHSVDLTRRVVVRS